MQPVIEVPHPTQRYSIPPPLFPHFDSGVASSKNVRRSKKMSSAGEHYKVTKYYTCMAALAGYHHPYIKNFLTVLRLSQEGSEP